MIEYSRKETILGRILVAGVCPYFLDKTNQWFKENMKKLFKARQFQPFLEENTLFLEQSQALNFSLLLRRLDEMGYEKVEKVEELGEFAVRGGVVDVFPINTPSPLRIEFRGNHIESLVPFGRPLEKEETAKKRLKKKLKAQKLFSDLKNIKPGDYLVHLDHGVGRFLGIRKLQVPSYGLQDYYLLEYAKGDKLYVPLGLERKLSRYVGFREPKISRLASPLWQRTKRRIKEGAEKLARELLALYAQREVAKRPPYLPNSAFDLEIKSSFPFEETPDQSQAIEEIRRDLEREEPMDRIVCGDVGFGKTELALRALVRAAASGRQAVMICPTTILAAQHFQTFSPRLKNLPFKTALLSRLQPEREQQRIVQELKQGEIDIVVGTHRLLSRDVAFKRLGLLVIDEEQRFGVRQKEKFKKLRASLDVLSLSATPIPRTLYLALSSLRDISFVHTPPPGRKAIKTIIQPWSEKVIREAITFELGRGGQVYYLHNRIETISHIKHLLEKLSETAEKSSLRKPSENRSRTIEGKMAILHGRLPEKEMIRVMEDFRQKKINILVATTIIETGLDFPDVNTLIVADATRLGLAQAYQIRGRIGRSPLQAYAYFLYPPSLKKLGRAGGRKLPEKAKQRLTALKEAEALGSGYKVARQDLEIRGAGNILGREQAGRVNAVGLNLYCQMIAEAVEKLKTK